MSRPERVYHQDYIARIRYSNTLPPPPNPPKLLDIPGTGLSGGEYTNASYGTRLAREQPLNIEADAELGMPIDLVGLPGVFDGNEAAIMAREPPLPLHPHDRALLKPLSQIGKGNSGVGATFLRKTEYISSDQGIKRYESSTSRDLFRVRNDPKRKNKAHLAKEDPLNILKNVIKGFDIAYPKDAYNGEDTPEKIKGAEITTADITAWSNPKHPKNGSLKLLDSYPVLPDLDALPGVGSYMLVKYSTDPSASTKGYDPRLDVTILKPTNPNTAKFEDRMATYERDMNAVMPTTEYDYEMYMLEDSNAVKGVKRKFDVNDPENDDSELYTFTDDQGNQTFKYKRIRAYETYQQQGDGDNAFGDSVALALHDPELGLAADGKQRLQKGAYLYPVLQRTQLRPKRKAQNMYSDDSQTADTLLVTVRDGDEEEVARRLAARAKLDTALILPEANENGASQEVS
ncbi:putative RNA polymerase II-associated protein [Elsinoe australis]|uniref:Putative RNA polymerase II-associated protein n=1 Tax=Elsinoe australis TaxID=40998 RepID=A0A4U7B631_9PEZI|nr:putative RNA polymerase II-associated protein [Elsinoe australis]